PVYKVTIIPRGRALGVTMFLPEGDRYSHSKEFLESQICSLFGGRIAEELVFGADKVTTGASNDIMRSTELARNMVTKWGLSDNLGPLLYDDEDADPWGRGPGAAGKGLAGDTVKKIDEEIRTIIDDCYSRAKQLLEDNRDILETMTETLMKYETIDASQIDDLMERREVREPDGWSDSDENGAGGAQQQETAEEPESAEQQGDVSDDVSDDSGDEFDSDADATDKPLH
ncbi:MAG: ATP-dependent metalloprotease, partial [Motiliproteus sp.]|nr:ATP-dependent metalloprotease [Motiliproteus sp.]